MNSASARPEAAAATAIVVAFAAGVISATLLILRALAEPLLENPHLLPDPIMTAVWNGVYQIPLAFTTPGVALLIILCGISVAANAVSDIRWRNKPCLGLYATGYMLMSGGVSVIFMQFAQTSRTAATLVVLQMALLAIYLGAASLGDLLKQTGASSRISRAVRYVFRRPA